MFMSLMGGGGTSTGEDAESKENDPMERVIGGLQNIFQTLLNHISDSKNLFLGLDLDERLQSSISLPQLAQTLEVAWLNLDGEEDVYSKKHLVWLCCLVAVTELSRDSLLNFHGGSKLLLKALTELIQVIEVPEHLWITEAEEINTILDQHQEELLQIHADHEVCPENVSSVRVPRAAAHALGMWPEQQVGGKSAGALGTTLMIIPGGLTVFASVVGGAMLYHAGQKEINRLQEERDSHEILEQRCFEKAQILLKRKVSPIRITNTLVQEEFPEVLKICLFHDYDLLEFIPTGGLNGPGIAYCAKGSEASLRPPVLGDDEVYKLKIFRPRTIINEPLLTVHSIRRGDRILLAQSPVNKYNIIAQRI